MRNSVLILLADSDSESLLADVKESTSSMKMMDGLWSLAISKRLRTSFSDSPNHLDTKSDEETEKNVELSASVATAFAKYDLPETEWDEMFQGQLLWLEHYANDNKDEIKSLISGHCHTNKGGSRQLEKSRKWEFFFHCMFFCVHLMMFGWLPACF